MVGLKWLVTSRNINAERQQRASASFNENALNSGWSDSTTNPIVPAMLPPRMRTMELRKNIPARMRADESQVATPGGVSRTKARRTMMTTAAHWAKR
jgi:hypothetical protein